LALGQRLRGLYVDQLGFMPTVLQDANHMYLRATPIPRALESVQQTFYGLYPPSSRAADFVPPTIVQRQPSHETLFPNEGACRRFAQLSQAFAQRTSDRWNDSPDMAYLNKMFGKWMPQDSPTVKVDGHPRLRFVYRHAWPYHSQHANCVQWHHGHSQLDSSSSPRNPLAEGVL
jgi:acid phosphatase